MRPLWYDLMGADNSFIGGNVKCYEKIKKLC